MKVFFNLLILITMIIAPKSFGAVDNKLKIGGIYYKKIIQTKDVIADVLPPPGYIIESYLTTLMLVDELENALSDKVVSAEEEQKMNGLVDHLRELKEGVSGTDNISGYFERIKLWEKELKNSSEVEKKIRKLMLETAFTHARDFYAIYDSKFLPALKVRNLDAVKKIRLELQAAYNSHRKAVDEIVVLARQEIADSENLLNSKNETDLSLNGVVYNKILLMKDLVSDILPPPCFVIESYLLSREMIYEIEKPTTEKAFAQYKERLESLERDYFKRYDYWQNHLELKNLKKYFFAIPLTTGRDFYKVQNEELFFALKKADIGLSKKILREKMAPIFSKHHKGIVKVVDEADSEYIKLENEVLSLKIKR